MTEKITIGTAEVWALLDMVSPSYMPKDFFPSVPLSVAQVMEPQGGSRADIDGEEALKIRVDLVNQVQREGMVMAAGHFPTGSHFGRIVLKGGRRYWRVGSL